MKTLQLALAGFFLCCCLASATAQDTLIVKTLLGTYRIFGRDGKQLKLGYVLKSAKDVPQARKYFKRARWYQAGTYVVGEPAGLLLGYEVGYYAGAGKWQNKELLNYSLIGVGVSHIIAILRNRAIRKGVKAYNQYMYELRTNYDGTSQ
jgi:hypothetical protein